MMKPKDYNGKIALHWRDYYVEPKIDGIRGYFYQGKLLSYNHKPIYNADLIVEQIQQLGLSDDHVLDGELYSVKGGWEKTLSVLKSSKTQKDLEDIKFYAFDLFAHPTSKRPDVRPLEKRKEFLAVVLKQRFTHLERLEHLRCPNEKMFRSIYQNYLVSGYEGIMLKNKYAPYQWLKRTNDWLRLKPTQTADVTVLGLQPGNGKYAETLGALVCKDEFERPIKVSGMTDAERNKFWKLGEKMRGKTVEVKFFKRTKANNMYSAQFLRLRDDK